MKAGIAYGFNGTRVDLFCPCPRSEIAGRRSSQRFSEHVNESARRAVARFKRRVSNFRALRQEPHRLHQPKLLPPLAKRQARVLQEKSLHRSPAGASRSAKLRERPAVPRVGQQCFRDSQRPRIRWRGKLQRNRLDRFQLVQNHVDQMRLPPDPAPQPSKHARMQNQFFQQRRHVHHATSPRQTPRQPRPQIQSTHRHHP